MPELFQLSPDKLKKYGVDKPALYNLSPDRLKKYDMDDPEIPRQNDDQVFDGSTYTRTPTPEDTQPWYQRMGNAIANPGKAIIDTFVDSGQTNSPENDKLYQESGDSNVGPVRLQHTTDDNGNKSTQFVPPPGTTPATRVLGGGALEAVKGTAGFAEWGYDTVVLKPIYSSLKLLGFLDQNQVTPDMVNWASENLPTLPAQNSGEKLGQEAVSMVAGAMGGSGLARAGLETEKGIRLVADIAQKFFSRQQLKDPANAIVKTELFVKSAMTELLGANTGATVTTPDNTDSWTGGLVEGLGADAKTADKIGTFVDNTAMTGAIGAASKLGKATWQGVIAPFFKGLTGNENTEEKVLRGLLENIDPDLAKASPDEFAKRAKLLATTMRNSSTVQAGDVTLNRSPANAMNHSAMQYVEQAYGHLRPNMGPEAWTKFANEKAARIPNAIAELRRGAPSDYQMLADAELAGQVSNALGTTANALATPDQIKGKTQEFADSRVVQPLNTIQTDIAKKTQEADLAQGQLNQAKNDAQLLPAKMKNDNPAPFGSWGKRNEAVKGMAQDMADRMVKSDQEVADAFQNQIPSGVQYNREKVAKAIVNGHEDYSDQVARLMNTEEDPAIIGLTNVGPDVKPTKKAKRELKVDELESWDLKRLFNRVRPWASKQINMIKEGAKNREYQGLGGITPAEVANMKALQNLKKAIDDEVSASGVPEFDKAMKAHADDMDTFAPLSEMNELKVDAISASKAPGQKGKADLRKNMFNFINNSLKGSDESGENLDAILKANQNDPRMSQVVLDSFYEALARGSEDGYITAAKLESAAGPYAQAMSKTNPLQARLFDQMTQILRSAENGNENAVAELSKIKQKLTEEKAKLSNDIASNFIAQNGDGLVPTEDVGKAYKGVFNSADKTKELLAKASNDPELISAIQSQFLRQLEQDITTSRPISATGRDARIINEPSLSQLRKINGQPNSANTTPKQVMDMVLASDPKLKSTVDILLNELEKESSARQLRIQNFSSNTAPDTARQRAISTLITATVGFMTKTGHMIRNVSQMALGSTQASEQKFRQEFIPKILGNAKEFSDNVDLFMSDPSKVNQIAASLSKLIGGGSTVTKAVVTANKPESHNKPTSRPFKGYDNTGMALGTTTPKKPVEITVNGGN